MNALLGRTLATHLHALFVLGQGDCDRMNRMNRGKPVAGHLYIFRSTL